MQGRPGQEVAAVLYGEGPRRRHLHTVARGAAHQQAVAWGAKPRPVRCGFGAVGRSVQPGHMDDVLRLHHDVLRGQHIAQGMAEDPREEHRNKCPADQSVDQRRCLVHA
eukprot:scaffold4852_cov28-Prasinocladus_malaysianus.AAC.1